MNQEIKNKWVAALRSGDYRQGKNALRKGEYHCCLGVLCEIAVAEGVVQQGIDHHGDSLYGPDEEYSFLPREVIKWSGFEVRNPYVEYEGDTHSLAGLNDKGKTFSEIADIIEAQL